MRRILLIVVLVVLAYVVLSVLIVLIDVLLRRLGLKRPLDETRLPPDYGYTTCVNCGAWVGTGSPGCSKCGAHM